MPDQPRIDRTWAWQPYRPTAENPWDVRKVAHLYRRAAFGATIGELEQGLRDGPQRTVERLLRGGAGQQNFENLCNRLARPIKDANDGNQLTAWWLYKIAYSPHPTLEKLTLFWHDHFATSNLKVNNAGYMLGQYALMHRHALGRFDTMLQEISLDPAMMIWLDTVDSVRGRPNENYARELMELFSLGIYDIRNPRQPNYTEEDIREAARAFTGYRIVEGRAVFRPELHDPTEKTVFGRRGRWRAEDIVRLCLEHRNCPYFITRKLFQFLIAETFEPTAELLEPLAEDFRRDYNIGRVVERMLKSNLFFSPHAYRAKIKSPVEFAIGIVRGLEGRVGTLPLSAELEKLGQRLFYPPSVAGWDEGRAWLNGQTLLDRNNLALALTSTNDDRFANRCDPARLAARLRLETDEEQIGFFLRLFLQEDVPAAHRRRLQEYVQAARRRPRPAFWTEQDAEEQRIRAICHLVLTFPEYQLN